MFGMRHDQLSHRTPIGASGDPRPSLPLRRWRLYSGLLRLPCMLSVQPLRAVTVSKKYNRAAILGSLVLIVLGRHDKPGLFTLVEAQRSLRGTVPIVFIDPTA